MGQKKRILILSSNPLDTARLRFDQEIRKIAERLERTEYRKDFQTTFRLAVRFKDIRRALLDVKPHIFHFIGHGETKSLQAENELGNATPISTESLSGLFKLFSNTLEVVILNTCYSAAQASAIKQNIRYVIGMRDKIMDKAAIEFSIGFYDGLGTGESIPQAFVSGCNSIQKEFPNFPAHLIPVLLTGPSDSSHIG